MKALAKSAEKTAPLRRHLALWFPFWATDCLARLEPDLARRHPLALYEMQKSAMRLVALNREAAEAGLSEGQTLADARALCPLLIAKPIDRALLMSAFADLADWLSWASPLVEIHAARALMGDLLLDITGLAHLWGGEEKLRAAILSRLHQAGLEARAAIAPTIGASWALAHYADELASPPKGENGMPVSEKVRAGRVEAGAEPVSTPALMAEALAPLPVAALRIDDECAEALDRVGLKRIGQIIDRPRAALEARFGAELLRRLDEALGRLDERIVPRLPEPERMAERRFAEPVALIEDVRMVAADLALSLSGQLEARREGAQAFHLFLYRVDHKLMHLVVNAASATRDPHHIARLFSNRLERFSGEFDAGFGIDMIRLGASSVSTLDESQLGAFGEGAQFDLDRLYDRIASRLGPEALMRSKFADTHIPERAVTLEPVLARTPDDPRAAPDAGLARPLRLLPAPEEIAVIAEIPEGPPARMQWRRIDYRFRRASGPERIGVEWWRPGESTLTRDYYIAEDDDGRRFWLFREGLYEETGRPRWFLHGLFA
jgi:protein ImuB